MIHVERSRAPGSLSPERIAEERRRLEAFFNTKPEQRKQKRFKFCPVSTQFEDVRPALFEMFHGKCAFCESLIPEDAYMFLDRFRPRTDAIGLDGEVHRDHYWWLAYEWDNMYLTCTTCNKLKGNRFPVEKARAKYPAAGAELREEGPLLLDPCHDFPEMFDLLFDERGMVASETKQGRVTIEVFGLNRAPLVADRAEEYRKLRERWDTPYEWKGTRVIGALALLEERNNLSLPFLAMRRQFLWRWSEVAVGKDPRLRQTLEPFLSYAREVAERMDAQEARSRSTEPAPRGARKAAAKPAPVTKKGALKKVFKEFKEYKAESDKYSVTEEKGLEGYYLSARFIEHVEISNFKIINKLSLSFPLAAQQKGSWMVLLGENGTGKSTVLHALALALMGEEQRQRLHLDASEFVRYNCRGGFVKVHLTGSTEPITLSFSKNSKRFEGSPKEPRALLLGYGATRLLPRGKAAGRDGATPRKQAAKVENLFDPFTPLNDASAWLHAMPEEKFDLIANGLKDLLLLRGEETLARGDGRKKEIVVKEARRSVPLSDLSDGYQSVVALTADIMSVMQLRWQTMEEAEGIVLVDEIDAHLHPAWKMQVIERLRRAFPRLQFVVSSHDPLTLRGLDASEVTVMKRDEKGHPVALTELPSPKNLRVDQLLTSEFFGLNSTLDPELHAIYDEYYKLLRKPKPAAADRRRLDELKQQLDERRQFGSTRRERVMLEAADLFLAQQDAPAADRAARGKIEEQGKLELAEMWKQVTPR